MHHDFWTVIGPDKIKTQGTSSKPVFHLLWVFAKFIFTFSFKLASFQWKEFIIKVIFSPNQMFTANMWKIRKHGFSMYRNYI